MKIAWIHGIRLVLSALALVLSGPSSRASEIPAGGVTAGVGVNIHFSRGHESDLDLIAAAGFKFTRMDFSWAETERQKGIYDWSAYDELVAHLERRGLRPYFIFDYSNPLYEQMVPGRDSGLVLASPRGPESVAAFARWTAAAAKHFRGHRVVWEIWNEPNGSFWDPKADVKAYTALALATARAVRAADPHATILAPATSGFDWPFMEAFLKSGVLQYLDGVSVHPYRRPDQPPETAAGDYERLRGLIAANQPPSRSGTIPIISGEWGYSTCVNGVTLETQAVFCARQQLANSLSGVPISIWYDWKNDGDDPKENEHNFGTVRSDLTPKPAYTAIKTVTEQLTGFSIRNRQPVADPNDYILVLTNAIGETKLAAWTLDKPHTLTLAGMSSAVPEISVVDSQGKAGVINVDSQQMTLPLDAAPRYVAVGKTQWP
jgi:polysaccharide biosynthesis protein PslG